MQLVRVHVGLRRELGCRLTGSLECVVWSVVCDVVQWTVDGGAVTSWW